MALVDNNRMVHEPRNTLAVAAMIAGEACREVPDKPFLAEVSGQGFSGLLLEQCRPDADPGHLAHLLGETGLTLAGATISVELVRHDAHPDGQARAVEVARMLAAVNPEACLVLSDTVGASDVRREFAGRTVYGMGITEDQWITYTGGANYIAKSVREETGIRTLFRHHPATYVETPWEVETFLRLTNPGLIGLYLDTGHYAFADGDPVELLEKYGGRIGMMHLRGFDANTAWYGGEQEWDYYEQVSRGVFCPLGQGTLDNAAVLGRLHAMDYSGWIVTGQSGEERSYLGNLGI